MREWSINTGNAENAANRISERLKFKISRGGEACPRTPLATPACLSWPFGLATALRYGIKVSAANKSTFNRPTGYCRVAPSLCLVRVASPQTSFGVRLSRIHFSLVERNGEMGPRGEMNT